MTVSPLPYQQTIEAVITALHTEPTRGLDVSDARDWLETVGTN
jgi:hypothetical protein